MKHIVYLFLVITAMSYAQIGVGTAKPHPSTVMDLSLGKKGLLVPRVAKAEDVPTAMANKPNGLVVYDETLKAVRFFENGAWSPALSSLNPSIASDCAATVLEGTFVNGVALTAANKFTVTIKNTSKYDATVAFQPSDLVLSGVAGVTVASVSVASATIVKTTGTQDVVYTLSGTPTATGTLTATWKKLNLSCTKTTTISAPPPPPSLPLVLDCLGSTHVGTLEDNKPASGISSTISYTNGKGASYGSDTVLSTGVTGLTATLAAGSFATGAGTVTYNIGGIPSGNGDASFAISVGGQNCILTRRVDYKDVPSTITLAQNRDYIILSVKDDDYIPYDTPSVPATTGKLDAGGAKESMIDIQGSITTAGVTIKIPVTVTGAGGTLAAYSTTVSIPSNLTEDNATNVKLKLSWLSQVCTTATKFITATIQAVGGNYLAPKLDFNAGIGNDYLGLVVARFPIVFNAIRQASIFRVRVFPGIPDKMFGEPDNAGNRNTHLMLYYPIVAEDGKTWLSNRLGAHYANLNHVNFNPSKQATGTTVTGPVDHLAYGSLFQWGRKADGHELITWSSGTSGTPVYNTTTTTKSDNPTVTSFISGSSDWRVTSDNFLWETEVSTNNPCPIGFRVPTSTELTTLFASAGITGSSNVHGLAFNSLLKFSVAGYRNFSAGPFVNVGSVGTYWSSSLGGTNASYRYLNSGGTATYASARASGFSVACLKD